MTKRRLESNLNIQISLQISYDDFKSTCDRLGGEIPVVRDFPDLSSVHADAEAAMAAIADSAAGAADECYIRDAAVKFLVGQIRREGKEYWWVVERSIWRTVRQQF